MAILRRAEYVTLGMGLDSDVVCMAQIANSAVPGRKIGGDNFAVIVIIYAGNVALLGRFGYACTRL